MMANHPAHDENSPDQEQAEAVNHLSEAIQALLNREQMLQGLIADLYSARLRGEPVQEELNALFDDDDELLAMAQLANEDALQKLLTEAVELEYLDVAERESFESLWDEIGWVAEGVKAYEIAESDQPAHWTDKEMGVVAPGEELLVEHSLVFGVDTVHDIRAPAWKFFIDAVQRLQLISQVLPTAVEEGDIGAEELAEALDTHDILIEIAATLEELEAGDAVDSEDSATDSGLGASGDDRSVPPSADDPANTGEDEQATDENDVMSSPGIGFQ
jgi:hypothetical protein